MQRIIQFSTALSLSLCVVCQASSTYYVNPDGNDSADGLTPATAWKTVAKVNATTFSPGSQVLFASGGEWREQLVASSSGTAAAPIVYGSYGTGAKPKFFGSDVVPNSAFTKVAETASTYVLPTTEAHSVLANQQFYHSSAMLTGSSSVAANRAYVDANPNTWYFDSTSNSLYVNTNGTDPTTDGRSYTVTKREDAVLALHHDNLVFRNLATDETAKWNGGYGIRVQHANNVRLEGCETWRAAKHGVGVINSTGFVGDNLYAADFMPDQVYGGSSAFVSFSDASQGRSGDTSAWLNCVSENLGGPYLSFYTHGTGMGDILIKNLVTRGGAGLAVGTEGGPSQDIRIEGGLTENGTVTLYGDNTVVDGMRVTGPDALFDVRGSGNVVQNVLMTGVRPSGAYFASMYDRGTDNVFQFNTVEADPTTVPWASILAIINASSNTTIRGNVFDTPGLALRKWFNGPDALEMDWNLFSTNSGFDLNSTAVLTLAQWQALGNDQNSLAENILFNPDYSLVAASLGLDRLPPGLFADMPAADFYGNPRGYHNYDLGAVQLPEPSAFAGVCAVLLAACRRRRSVRAATVRCAGRA